MAPLTRWVEEDGLSSAPVAVARVTTVCPLSQCTLVPLGCLLRDLHPSTERALGHQRAGRRSGASLDSTLSRDLQPVWRGPRATSERVDGRVQDWTRLFQGTSNPVWRGPRATSEPVDGRVQDWTGLFQGTSNPVWRGPRATSEPVDGRVQAWTRLALGHDHRNVGERIGRDQPTRMGKGRSQ